MQSASHVYTDGAWGEPARTAYEAAMTGTEVVLRTWYDSTTSPLANKYAWFTGGSLAMAIETVTGKQPQYVFTDVRDEANAKLIDSVDALRAEFRVRLFNRKWIEGMMREGYAGADQMQVMTSNVFGWATMRDGSVGQDVWADIKSVYLDDKLELGLRKFFAEHNPFAEQLLAGRLLEAARKGYWRADAAQLQQVAQRYLESVAQHGSAGGLEAGKGKVKAYAQSLVPPQPTAAAESSAATAKPVEASAPVAKAPQRERVFGQKLERAPDATADRRAFAGTSIVIGALLCFLAGLLRRPS
jgi:cobaltochelatase CobN